jgi:hypothetical protein
VVRVVAFLPRLGTGAAATAGSVMVERILDLLCLVACLMIGLAMVTPEQVPAGLRLVGGSLGAAILIGGALVLAGAGWFRPWCEGYGASGIGLSHRVAGIAARVLLGMDLVRDPRRLARIVGCSVLAWAGELGLYTCVVVAIGAGVGPGSLLAMAAGNLATLIPGTPGHVGTFHYFATEAMVAAGTVRDQALAAAILTHLIFWGGTTTAGLIALAAVGRRPVAVPA